MVHIGPLEKVIMLGSSARRVTLKEKLQIKMTGGY